MLEGLPYLVFLLLLLVLFLILLFIFLFLLCASRLPTRQAKIDRPPGTAASLLMGTRARDGGGRQNRGKTGLTTQENECEKGKSRLRENRRSMDDRGMSLVPVDRRGSARPCCKSRAPRIRLTAQCPSPPRRAWWRAGPGQAPSDYPASPPNPGPKVLTTCGAPPESWPPRGGAY